MTAFIQAAPVLANQYDDDPLLRSYLRRVLPAEMRAEIEPDLQRFGARVVGDILAMGRDAEAHPPRLIQYDAWGQRIDQVSTARGWQELDAVSATEGLVAIAYQRAYGALSRVYQFAKLYLFTPSSAIYTCPLAMTDGAARLIEVYGDAALRTGAYRHLTTRDPRAFWTSGQWMTERTGGSDVGNSETVACCEHHEYRLYGDKWFTSATTSQMAMTLARIVDAGGQATPGSRGLSLFYLETRAADGALNRIHIHRLKDKLGTRALPTAELTLDGTLARLVGVPGQGVRQIATMFNVTRIYNAIAATSLMRRGIALARDYARRRRAFGRTLAEHPLFVETMAGLATELAGALHLSFHVAALQGREECAQNSAEDSAVLRLLTPLAKLFTARQSIAVASEVIECFGGAGYVEDTGLPVLLRDSQVLAIWEGTTNVLSLDVLRAITRDAALAPLLADLETRLATITHPALVAEQERVRSAAHQLRQYADRLAAEGPAFAEAGGRGFAYGLARTVTAALLLEHAQWALGTENDPTHAILARRWCAQPLAPLVWADTAHRSDSARIAFEQ